MRRSSILLCLCLLIVTGSSSARTWVIEPDSTGDAPTIQAGIDSAAAGDTVLVSCGTYNEHDISMKSGVWLTSATGEADCAVIGAEAMGRVFFCDGVDSLAGIVGFTAKNGLVTDNGGGLCCLYSDLEITNCRFEYNQVDSCGGGVSLHSGSSVFTDCEFHANVVVDTSRGAGVYVGPGFYEEPGAAFFDGCVFSDNQAIGGAGGGLYADTICVLEMTDCLFERNSASWGAGAYLNTSPERSTVAGCTFRDNTGSSCGGLRTRDCVATVTGCLFETNLGGGMFVEQDSVVTITDCTFIGNTHSNGAGLGISKTPAVVSRCLFFDNVADWWGGGVKVHYKREAVFTDCVFAGNKALSTDTWCGGGGLAARWDAKVRLVNCTFFGNSAAATGGAISLKGFMWSAKIENCIMAFSTDGEGLYWDGEGYSPVITCSDIYGNADGDWVGPIAGQYGVKGNISEHPLFCDPDSNDFYLSIGSPCLDADTCGTIGAFGAGCSLSYGLLNVVDHPDDHGGAVDIAWYRIGYDSAGSDTLVDYYSVWRRDETSSIRRDGDPEGRARAMLTDPPGTWQQVDSVAATGEFVYTVTCSTLCDSTEAEGICWSAFFVRTHCSSPELEFDTEPDSGYSFANLPSVVWTDVTTTALRNPSWGHGFAWVDFDNDDDHDIFIANRQGQNKLLRNDSLTAAGFVDATPGVLADAEDCRGAAWGDYDGDGDLDLYVSKNGANRLYRNDGAGSFVDVTVSPLDDGGIGQTVSWADYDRDGDMDLYLVNNGTNRLFRNDSAGVFTTISGTPLEDPNHGMGCGWADYDDDGDLDLYVANYDAANVLLENQGGDVFVDATTPVVGIIANSTGVAWGDYDNDGDLDLYVGNNGPNNLLRNDGGVFTDVSASPVHDSGNARSAVWGDYNLDGNLDLYVVNYNGQNRLFKNKGGGIFVIPECAVSPITDNGLGFGTGWCDYDKDGDLDVYVVNDGNNKLLRNDLFTQYHWLEVRLVGTTSNTYGQGSRVRIVASGTSQMREIAGASGYLSQGPLTAFFGLGPETTADTIEVTWPSGNVDLLPGVPVDQSIEIVEDDQSGIVDRVQTPSVLKLYPGRPNPSSSETTIRYDLPDHACVNLAIYDVSGRLVRKLLDGDSVAPGRHTETWNGRNQSGRRVSAGIYFCRLDDGAKVRTQRVVLVK